MITVPSWYYQKGPAQVSEHVSGQTTDVAIKITSAKTVSFQNYRFVAWRLEY